jgi:hypothetical protein
MYLYRPTSKKGAAHLWNGHDTLCTMYSTGGMSKRRNKVMPTADGRRICAMCQVNNRKSNYVSVWWNPEQVRPDGK